MYLFQPLHPNQLTFCVPSSQLSSSFTRRIKDYTCWGSFSRLCVWYAAHIIITYQHSRIRKTASKAMVTVVLFISVETNARRSTGSIFLHCSSSLEWRECVRRGKFPQELIKPSTAIWMTSATTGTKRPKTYQVKYKLQTFPVLIDCTLRENLKVPWMVGCSNFPPPAVVDCHDSKYLHTHRLRHQCCWVGF